MEPKRLIIPAIILVIIFAIISYGCIKGEKNQNNVMENENNIIEQWDGMTEILDEIQVDEKKITLLLIGEGFQDKAFFIVLYDNAIPRMGNGKPDTEQALLYEYIDLKEVETEENVFKATRFVETGSIDWKNKKVKIEYSNGDSEYFNIP